MDTDEEWRVLDHYPGCLVSNGGRVRGPSGSILKPVMVKSGTSGYKTACVSLKVSNRFKRVKVAHLVLTAFVGPGTLARHKDDDPTNNRLRNLAWGTHADNGRDRVVNGRVASGTRNGNSSLDEKRVAEIRKRWALHKPSARDGHGLKDIARDFNVSYPTIHQIVTGRTWNHVRQEPANEGGNGPG